MKRPMQRPRSNAEKRWQAPRVVLQPEVYQGMQAGINKIVDVIRPTLGPRPRIVAMEKVAGGHLTPEMLDDGGTIARRIIQLPGRNEDVGAMYIRHVLWRLHEKVGDGTATAAVIFKEVYNQGLRYLASGGNAMRLRTYLEEGMKVVFNELDGMTSPLEGKEALARMAESICYDPPLAKMIGEIFEIIRRRHGKHFFELCFARVQDCLTRTLMGNADTVEKGIAAEVIHVRLGVDDIAEGPEFGDLFLPGPGI